MLTVQTNVSDVSSTSLRTRSNVRLHADDGLRSVRRQALPVQFPLVQLGRSWKGRSTHAWTHPRASGLAGQGSSVDETDRVVRQTQAHQ